MTPLRNTLLFSPLLLLTLSIQDPTEACSCFPAHPQERICNSDFVIHASAHSEKVVQDSSFPLEIIQYEIKPIKIFKGFEKAKNVQYVFTPLSSATCGAKLKVNDEENNQYLLSGDISSDGRFFIYLCNFIKPWNDVTPSQKKNLDKEYIMGCDCTITACPSEPCPTAKPNECLWTDWLKEETVFGHQANNAACFKDSDGTCRWHQGLP